MMTSQPDPSRLQAEDSAEYIRQALLDAPAALDALISNAPALEAINRAAELLSGTFAYGGRVYSCGNGGSMSDAMHFGGAHGPLPEQSRRTAGASN